METLTTAVLSFQLKFATIKICSCGIEYTHLPKEYKLLDGIYWFDCICNSTLCYITSNGHKKLEQIQKEAKVVNAQTETKRRNDWVLNSYRIKKKKTKD